MKKSKKEEDVKDESLKATAFEICERRNTVFCRSFWLTECVDWTTGRKATAARTIPTIVHDEVGEVSFVLL